jgi:hypothetical protein
MIAMTALVAAVWIALYVARIGEIRRRKLDPQSIRTSALAAGVFQNVAAADNFRNLFEVPVLFYAICCALAIVGAETPAQIALAWLFVGLRTGHTLIHITYNRVMHRFSVHALSTLVIWIMWALFAVRVLGEKG